MWALFLALLFIVFQVALFSWIVGFLRQIVLVQIYGDPPFVPTPRQLLAKTAASLDLQPGDVVYELGSGDGRFLFHCAHSQPHARYVGIEKNPALIWFARTKATFMGYSPRVTFRRESFHQTDLSPATKIYAFLLSSSMDDLLPKIEKEFRGRIASRAFPFSKKSAASVVTLSDTKGAFGEHLLHVYNF